MSRYCSRRLFLAGITGSTVGLAGCTSEGAVDGFSQRRFDALVSGVTVEARDVVVELDSNDVTELVLIGPDGTKFDSQTVTTGVSTVRFPIIELDLELSTSSHYTPGEYELIAVVDEAEFSKTVMIAPDLRISAVDQYQEGDSPTDLARISFSVENVGTGPTWIYDIAFSGSPNYTANGDLNGSPSIPYLHSPITEDTLILAPNETQQYIDGSAPLMFPDSQHNCESQLQPFDALLGIADGSELGIVLTPSVARDSITVESLDQTVCTQVRFDWQYTEAP